MRVLATRRMMFASLTFFLLVLALAVLLTGCTQLQPYFTYQGRLLRPNGATVPDGNYNVRYNLYKVSSGGVAVYTETETINVQKGLFNSVIGSNNDNLPPDFFSEDLYLEVTINGQTLSPRQKLYGAPYAMSLVPESIVKGSVPITRTYAGQANTGATLGVINYDSSATGGHSLWVVNQAAPSGTARDRVAALQVRAIGGQKTSSPFTGSYAGMFESANYRGILVKGSSGFYAASFNSNIGIEITGGGNCTGCTMAYDVRNEGPEAIAPGDLVASVGVVVDAELGQPIILVRKAHSGDAGVIGVAAGARERVPVEEYYGARTGGLMEKGGVAQSGEYLSVVVQGLAQVKASSAAPVKMGDRLAAADDGAAPAESLEGTVGRVMSDVDADGMVWVMVDAR